MKLYPKAVPRLAKDLVDVLVGHQDIEVLPDMLTEAYKDFEGIFNEYIRQDRAANESTRDMMAARGMGSGSFSEAKRVTSGTRRVPQGDDAIDYLLNQMLEFLMISSHVEEVFAEDHVMRKHLVDVLRKHLKIHDDVEEEVRKRIRHLQEGTTDWEIAYQKTLEEVRRAKGLA